MKNRTKIFLSLLALVTFLTSLTSGEEIRAVGQSGYESGEASAVVTMSPGERIRIISTNYLTGNLNIETIKGNEARFKFQKRLKAPDQATAIDFAGVIDISLEKNGSEIKLLLKSPNPAPWSGSDNSGRIDGELTLPEGCLVEFEAGYFDVNMTGKFKGVKNVSTFGRMEIDGVDGDLELSSSNRDIIVKNIKGDISISASYADIIAEGIESIGPATYMKNENGNITIVDFKGAFDIRNDFGRIKVDKAVLTDERSSIRGSYSPIKLSIDDMIDAGLTVRNNNEDIEISVPENGSADFSLKVEGNGEIHADGLTIVPTYVDYNRLDFKIGEGDSRVRVSVGGKGNISINGYEK